MSDANRPFTALISLLVFTLKLRLNRFRSSVQAVIPADVIASPAAGFRLHMLRLACYIHTDDREAYKPSLAANPHDTASELCASVEARCTDGFSPGLQHNH
jgi:hypothetical protein